MGQGAAAWFAGRKGPQALSQATSFRSTNRPPCSGARLMAEGRKTGRPCNAMNTIISAVAEAHGCTIVTDTEKDFASAETLNPVRTA